MPYAEGKEQIFCLFAARAFISGTFQAAYVYTPEVYPTSTRAVGLGACRSVNELPLFFSEIQFLPIVILAALPVLVH